MVEKLVRAGETDAYVIATEGQMRRRQGCHVSCSIVDLAARPDLDLLKMALAETLKRHPMLAAIPRRPFPGTQLWYVKSQQAADAILLSHWKESGVEWTDAQHCNSAETLLDFLLNDAWSPKLAEPHCCNVRIDILARADSSWWLVLTWRHVVLDGIGAEWLLREIASLCENPAGPSAAPSFGVPAGSARKSLHDRWKATKPMLDHLMTLMKGGIRSLTRKDAVIGRMKFDYQILDLKESAQVKRRAAAVSGPLIQTPFFLACALRAHDEVWRIFRGDSPEQFVVALPMQDRPRGRPGPIFRNNVSVMFLHAQREEMRDLESLTALLLKRQQTMLKDKLPDSFAEMQRWMMMLPGPLYTFFLDRQMKGETTSFHHSHTGTFAGGLEMIAGAAIQNGFHIPGFYAPPGTGIFVSEKGGRMSITVSWREGVLTLEEATLLRESFVQLLIGEPPPHGNV